MAIENFAEKLGLVLKALSMSRGRLAFELKVDKSLVSRWVSGAVTPSSHNLSELTRLLASKQPGFTMLDWDRDTAGLASLFGIDASVVTNPVPPQPAAASAPADLIGFPLRATEGARRETERRGASYEGLWNSTRPASTRPGVLVRERVMIRRRLGVLEMRWGSAGHECRGWLLLQHGMLYGMLFDDADDSMAFFILNGVVAPRVGVIDGLTMANAMDTVQTPTAQPILLERAADLTGDEAEDDARFEALKHSSSSLLEEGDVPENVRAHLFRDFGPVAFANGGDMVLRLPMTRSMSWADVGVPDKQAM